MEAQIALAELVRRLKNPRLVMDSPPYRTTAALRGPVTFGSTSTASAPDLGHFHRLRQRSFMRAFQLAANGTAELHDVPVPEPRPGEVLVRVGAADVCHSDLHMIDNPAPRRFPLPSGTESLGGSKP
jgi:Alcohol dehydrogenase GroES-like domain